MKLQFDTSARLAGMALALAAALTLPAHAQPTDRKPNTETGSTLLPRPVKMDTKEFLSTHHWDEETDKWALNPGVTPPAGVISRAQVKAQRDAFLSKNRWNETASQYEPIGPVPRDMSTLTRAQVKAETRQFMLTHRYDEETADWVAVPIPARNPMR
jgi:hypothetical protein